MFFHSLRLSCKGPDSGQVDCHLCCFLAARSCMCLSLWTSNNLFAWEVLRTNGRAGMCCSGNIFSHKLTPTGRQKCSTNKTQNTAGRKYTSNSYLPFPGSSRYISLLLACRGLHFPLSLVLLLFLHLGLLESFSSLQPFSTPFLFNLLSLHLCKLSICFWLFLGGKSCWYFFIRTLFVCHSSALPLSLDG